jgi:hypothetical protein
MAQISFDKSVFNKGDFNKLVNRNFSQLINNLDNQEAISFTLEDFFQLYENLFIQIPKEGDIDSHRYMLNRAAEYLGIKLADETDIQALLNEITVLRNDLLASNKTLAELNKR